MIEKPPPSPDPIELQWVLFVEGQWDGFVVRGLCNQRSLASPQIVRVGGKDRFFNQVQARLKEPAFTTGRVKSVGFLRDSNGFSRGSGEDAFKSLCDVFRKLSWPLPSNAGEFVVTPGGYRAGIFIVPALQEKGMMETLLLRALKGDPAIPCVDAYLGCLANNGRVVEDHVKDKARLQAFVASMQDPQKSLGVILEKTNTMNYESPVYNGLAGFVAQLVSP